MALLEQIISMKEKGMNDVQIINTLKEQGFSPMEINESLAQSKIKAAISDEPPAQEEMPAGMEGMQASVMAAEGQAYISSPNQASQASMPYAAEIPYAQAAAPEAAYYSPEAQPQAPEQYAEQAAYQYPQEAQAGYYAQALDLETVRDIAKQQVEEALKKIREEISGLLKFRSEIKFEMQDIQNRLAKVESTMNELQYSVIKKVSDYGEQISGISKELQATQNSFSKIVGPLMDRARGAVAGAKPGAKAEIKAPEQPKEKSAPKSKKEKGKSGPEKEGSRLQPDSSGGASFEDYFR